MTEFVNPYTFVPHARSPERGRPAGHAVMREGQLSGVLRVTLTARTPLLIGGFGRKDDDGQEIPDVPRRGDGTPMVPGSGLLGAVRSVHEALAGGCLRVLDSDRVAVHRHPASTAVTDDLRLAVVLDVTSEGRPAAVGLCDRVIWIDKDLLPRDGDRVAQTGDRLLFPDGAAVDSGNRTVLRPARPDRQGGVGPEDVVRTAGMSAGLADSWVLLVTDTNARTPGKPVYFATGRLGPDTPVCRIPDDPPGNAWTTYCTVVDGADDLRPARLPGREEPAWGSRPPEYADVFWPVPRDSSPGGQASPSGQAIARRLLARHYLHKGQPVWVRTDGDAVTEIRLSQLWRYPGAYPAGERAGEAAPCTDPEKLCWSCRIFGSADTAGRRDDDIAVQRSYRGHVRADDLLATASVEPVAWHLAPLASPRPSAGQFYLDHTAVPERKRRAGKDTAPAATWGSCADDAQPRPIRGRKFYWRTTDPDKAEDPRGRHRHQSDTLSRHVVLLPAGTVFTGRVRFDNLSPADYGSLLAALDPRLLGEAGLEGWDGVVTSVGGGKPFGFGAVSIDVEAERVHTAGGRYLARAQDVPAIPGAVQAFRAGVPHPVSATWAALRNALTFGFIADDLVWYPPGTKGAKGEADFDRSFEFFARTTGLALSQKVRDLVVLPPADGSAQSQRLDSAAGERASDPDERPQRRGAGTAGTDRPPRRGNGQAGRRRS